MLTPLWLTIYVDRGTTPELVTVTIQEIQPGIGPAGDDKVDTQNDGDLTDDIAAGLTASFPENDPA